MNPLYSRRFIQLACVYINNEGKVLKTRPGYENIPIERLKEERLGLIQEEGRNLVCYMPDYLTSGVLNAIQELKDVFNMDISKRVIFK